MDGRRTGATRRELAGLVLPLCCAAGMVLGLLRALGGSGGHDLIAGATPVLVSAGQGLLAGFAVGAVLALAIVATIGRGRVAPDR